MGATIGRASRQLVQRTPERESWVRRVILGELAHRAATRGPAHWAEVGRGLTAEEQADRRIARMIARATVAGAAAAAGASVAEIASAGTEGAAAPVAVPLGLLAIGADVLYTTALQIELAFDLASIYGVPLAEDDVGEVAALLGMTHGVDLTIAAEEDATTPWRAVELMYRNDFADAIGRVLARNGIARNAVPIAGVLVGALLGRLQLRRYAWCVHMAVRHRREIARVCRRADFDPRSARTVVEGAWLIASACGPLAHGHALALSVLIDVLGLRETVSETRDADDDEAWLAEAGSLPPPERAALFAILVLVASADGRIDAFEGRFLRRVARAFERDLDMRAIQRHCARLWGEAPTRWSPVRPFGTHGWAPARA